MAVIPTPVLEFLISQASYSNIDHAELMKEAQNFKILLVQVVQLEKSKIQPQVWKLQDWFKLVKTALKLKISPTDLP